MKKWFQEWKDRLSTLRDVSEDPEYYDRTMRGRTEANRYTVGLTILFLFTDLLSVILTLAKAFPIYSVLWTVLLLGGTLLCHGGVVTLGFASQFSGKRTPYYLFSLLIISTTLFGLWVGEYTALLFIIPILLSIRYYDIFFSAIVSGACVLSFTVTTFLNSFLWESIGYGSYAGMGERLAVCFDGMFFVCLDLLLLGGIASVCSAVGGRLMILEESEILGARAQAELEVSEAKTQIMLSQIQPHFVYNTLNSICYLCGKNPEAAQSALSDFSDYLRENLNFSGKAELIPFERELAHINKYLSLEKMRFEDELNVEMDIECTTFRIPALSVQPLVENAVKHGVCHRDGGGTIRLETKETGEYYIIVIADDGVGFDPNAPMQDNRRHIGLENTRSRLAKMCQAKMEVRSTVGEGTVITISVPKEFYYDNSRG